MVNKTDPKLVDILVMDQQSLLRKFLKFLFLILWHVTISLKMFVKDITSTRVACLKPTALLKKWTLSQAFIRTFCWKFSYFQATSEFPKFDRVDLQSVSQYFEACRCLAKFSFHNKWDGVQLLLINMAYTCCLTSCRTT